MSAPTALKRVFEPDERRHAIAHTVIVQSKKQVRIEKQPVVTEEVKVSKRPVEETKKVSDKVRRERLRVEPEGGVSKDEVTGVNDREKK